MGAVRGGVRFAAAGPLEASTKREWVARHLEWRGHAVIVTAGAFVATSDDITRVRTAHELEDIPG